jgi:hypothetical protein
MVREGWSIDWYLQVIEHGEGGVEYSLVSGEVRNGSRHVLVSLLTRKLEQSVTVSPRMTTSLHILTGKAYRYR